MSYLLACVRPTRGRRSFVSRLAPIGRALAIAAVGIGMAVPAVAADTQWTGASDILWSNSANWSAGVPTASDNAQLVSGASNTSILLSGAVTANQLQVWDGATYTLFAGVPTVLTLTDQLFMFSDPAASSLQLIGLAVSSPNGSLGTGPGDVGGTLIVATNASLGITNTFNVGYDGRDNVLQVSGSFQAGNLFVGTLATGTSNDVNIVGGTITATNSLVVGGAGSFNSLVSAGALTVSGPGGVDIGTALSATSNSLTVSAGTFSATNTLIVGRAGDSNSFTVQLGSTATTGQVRIGLDNGADDNSATVSGAGSAWNVGGTVIVGSSGDGNSLSVLDGGALTIHGALKNLWIGKEVGSDNNTVTVDGVGSVLDVTGAGSEVVISGSTGVGNILILSNSGSANVNSIQTGPGGVLQIGDGSPAGFLNGTATINGNVGGLVDFAHNEASFSFPNRMSGPLSVTQSGGGKTTLTGSSSYTGKTSITSGTLALSGAASIASSGTIELSSGEVYDVSAVTGGYQLAAGQTLQGDGTVIGPVTAVVGSTVIPGTDGAVGTLSLSGGFSLLGDLKIDVDGSTIDLLDGASGSLTLGAGSTVTFSELTAIATNLIFAKYASLTGTFGTVTGLPSGYALDYNYLGGSQIALVAVPEIDPASAGSVLALVGGALGLLERRVRGRRPAPRRRASRRSRGV